MAALGNILVGIGFVLSRLLWLYGIVLFVTAVVSWVNADPRNRIVQYLRMATEPVLRIIRRMLPTNLRYFPIDISFVILIALVAFSQFAVAQTLIEIGLRLNPALVENDTMERF